MLNNSKHQDYSIVGGQYPGPGHCTLAINEAIEEQDTVVKSYRGIRSLHVAPNQCSEPAMQHSAEPNNTAIPQNNTLAFLSTLGGETAFTAQEIGPHAPPLLEVSNLPIGGIGGVDPQIETLKPAFSPVLPSGAVWSAYDVLLCYDTEWQSCDGVNHMLSMQLAGFVRQGTTWRYFEGVKYPDGVRPTWPQVAGWGLDLAKVPRRDTPRILMVAHYTVAEWSMLQDRMDYLEHLQVVGKTLVTTQPLTLQAVRPGHHYTESSLVLRDTMLLTPGRGSLAKASAITSAPKVSIPNHYKSRMSELLADDPDLFERYAMTDVRGGLEYLVMIGNQVPAVAGIKTLPMTLGGMSAAGFKNWLKSPEGYGLHVYHGQREKLFADDHGNQKKRLCKGLPRIITDSIASECYHGGRNFAACHKRSVTLPGTQIVIDFDLGGAYVAAMGALPALDLDQQPEQLRKIHDLTSFYTSFRETHKAFMPVAMGEVSFEFPAGVEPCLPVESGSYGLLYPRTGVSMCGLPEVLLALERGATIQLIAFYKWSPLLDAHGDIVPAFATYLSAIAQKRAAAKAAGDKFMDGMFKEMMNSLYGKLAQGSKQRRVRTGLTSGTSDLPASGVTHVVYAAIITSQVRAALCSIEQAMADVGGEVLAATTDGAMAVFDVPDNSIFGGMAPAEMLKQFPDFVALCESSYPIKAMMQGRINLGLDVKGWLEAKHFGDQYSVFKTRGYALAYRGKGMFIAKCGHKLDGDIDTVYSQMLDLFDDETPRELTVTSLMSAFDIVTAHHKGLPADLQSVSMQRKSNTDWDWKRDLDASGDSTPFESIADTFKHRAAAKSVRKSGNKATREAVKLNLARVKLQGGTAAAHKRMILRAIVRREPGWSSWSGKYPEIAAKLECTVQDLKNAKSRGWMPQTLPYSVELEQIARELSAALGISWHAKQLEILCLPGTLPAAATPAVVSERALQRKAQIQERIASGWF